jgi:cellulose synthase operon protein YhjU
LQQAGFETALLMNHDGKFGNFIDDLHQRGGLKMAPLGNLGATPHMRAFDGSPIYSDFDILSHWLEQRKQSPSMRTALFYSTISLHDGNIVDWSKSRSSLDTYGPRLQQLLEDMDRFVTELERQGRRAIVVFVPEHGANLRGDSMQIPGMREIPGPQITRVPVGIKLVGLKSVPGSAPQVVSSPSSYLALAELLARFIARNPFEEEVPDLQAYLSGLPQTEFVAENDKTVVVRHGSRYYIRMPDGSWSDFQ